MASLRKWLFLYFITNFYVMEIMCTEDCREDKKTINKIIPAHYKPNPRQPWSQIYVSEQREEIITGLNISCKNVKLPLHYVVKGSCNNCTQILTILSSNLSEIPPSSFVNTKTISRLILKNLNILKLSPGAFVQRSLVEINLSKNRLSEIGLGVFNSLDNLETLDLSLNQISKLETQSFSGMTNLKSLNLSHNSLLAFSYKVFDPNIHPMEALDLGFNPILHLTVEINIKIESLFLNNNELNELNFCPHLFNTVSLKNNHLKNLSSTFCTSKGNDLISFDVSCNNISSIGDFYFGEALKLQSLNLSHNNLSLLSPGVFYNMSNLKYLNMSYNNLKDFMFGTFDSLNNLDTLDISNNNFYTISASLHSLTSVNQLFIQNNHVQDINPDQLQTYFPQLKKIFFDNNNLSCDNVVNIVRKLKASKVEILHNNLRNSTNVHGLTCLGTPDIALIPKTLNKTDNETLKDYFDEIKNSSLYQMLEHIYSSEKGKNVGYSKNVTSDKSLTDKYLEDNLKNTQNFTNYFREFIENQKKIVTADNEVNTKLYKYIHELSHSQETKTNILDPEKLAYTETSGYNKMVLVLSINTVFIILLCLIALLIGYVLFKNNNSRAPNVREHVELLDN
ncbi:leucine-rich repeat-containing protein 15-like [Diabrotica virgifera virgifera]|uniref:Leucine-rich repeat-containing protein 15-like n=1 Tax=Diabrotica virgifera virgifera TaxID=50390 RepID=A0A6P7FFS2_DIAVI|nr:leucine-rich repeat-containing protein 15-like [Diabrotica virgifera virgifera]